MTTTPHRPLLKDRAFDHIKALILNGTYQPGQFISERELSAELEMSKTPIRAALERLEEQGFVVRTPDEDDRRRVQVDITPAGAEIVVETIRRRDELLADMLREVDYTEAELATLREASALMRRVVER